MIEHLTRHLTEATAVLNFASVVFVAQLFAASHGVAEASSATRLVQV